MNKNITIAVTRNHIRRGIKMEPKHCPVSLAIQEALPLIDIALVSTQAVDLYPLNWLDGGRVVFLTLPKAAASFVRKFDSTPGGLLHYLFVRPFIFCLDVPNDLLPSGPQRIEAPEKRRAIENVEAQEKKEETICSLRVAKTR